MLPSLLSLSTDTKEGHLDWSAHLWCLINRDKKNNANSALEDFLLALKFLPINPYGLLTGRSEVNNSLHVRSRRGCFCNSGPLGGANEQLPGRDTSGDSHTQITYRDASSSEPNTWIMNAVDEHESMKLQSFKMLKIVLPHSGNRLNGDVMDDCVCVRVCLQRCGVGPLHHTVTVALRLFRLISSTWNQISWERDSPRGPKSI